MIKFFRKIRQRLLIDNRFSKYLLYAIGEIILVVIGILIALQVNNWNEERIEQARITEYARSLKQDLLGDIEMLTVSMTQAQNNFYNIDSLSQYMRRTAVESLSNTDLFILTYDRLYRPYKWSRSTMEELKGSGSLRYISNDSLKKKLAAYEAFSKHLDEDFQGDYQNYNNSLTLITKVINFNDPYFQNILEVEATELELGGRDYFQSPYYLKSKNNELSLVSNDPALLAEMLNTFILLKNAFRTRGFLEMPNIVRDAEELIQLLEEEYLLPKDPSK